MPFVLHLLLKDAKTRTKLALQSNLFYAQILNGLFSVMIIFVVFRVQKFIRGSGMI